MTAARNVLIILALAAIVAFLPGGGGGADLIGAILSTLIVVALIALLARFYRERRTDIHVIGDRWRALLYGAVGLVVLALAGAGRLLQSGPGALLWFVLMGGAAYAFYRCWRHFREYA